MDLNPDVSEALPTLGQDVSDWALFRERSLSWTVRGPVHLLRFVSGGVLFGLAFLKAQAPVTACGPSGWEGVNSLMMLYELGGGFMLLCGTWPLRRFAAFAGTCVMASIVLFMFAIGAGLLKWSLSGCRCFGSMDLPWWGHALVAAAIGALLGWTWLAIESRDVPAAS